MKKIITPFLFYVVEMNIDKGLNQLSLGLPTHEDAVSFQETFKEKYPLSFILCSIQISEEPC